MQPCCDSRVVFCGLEVVDTRFGDLHSCGRAEKVYPPQTRRDRPCGRSWAGREAVYSTGREDVYSAGRQTANSAGH